MIKKRSGLSKYTIGGLKIKTKVASTFVQTKSFKCKMFLIR